MCTEKIWIWKCGSSKSFNYPAPLTQATTVSKSPLGPLSRWKLYVETNERLCFAKSWAWEAVLLHRNKSNGWNRTWYWRSPLYCAWVLRSSIMFRGPGQHTGTKWVWSTSSSVIICTQNMLFFPPHLIERLHRQWVHNSFVTVQTADARSPLRCLGKARMQRGRGG